MSVAAHGYPDLTETAFFPGLPAIMALFSLVGVPTLWTGMLVSLAGSGLAAWALFRLAGGSTGGTLAVFAWSFAPMAVFTFVPYTEAIFCAAAFWAFWYAKRDRWVIAASLAGAACLLRVSGLFLIGALALVALVGLPGSTWGRRIRRLAWLGIPAGVLAGYMIYLKVLFGSWTTWLSAENQGWGRAFDWPWNAIKTTWSATGIPYPVTDTYDSAVMFTWELVAFVIGVVAIVWALRRRQIPEGGWIGVQVLALSCQVWLISLARSVLLWFPVFLFIGDGGARPLSRVKNNLRRSGIGALLIVETLCMIWWASRFFRDLWAG